MQPTLSVLLAALTLSLASAAPENSQIPTDAKYDLNPLYQELRRTVRRHYPEATFHQLDDKIHFEYDTRIFIIHYANRVGEWQDPREERGPKQHGIIGDIQIVPGPYRGAADLPQSIDIRYFTTDLAALYNKNLDAHLRVVIKRPRNVPEGFREEINQLLYEFDHYVTANAAE